MKWGFVQTSDCVFGYRVGHSNDQTSREDSKPWDAYLDFLKRSGSAAEMHVKFQCDVILITPNLTATKHHEIVW